MIPSLPTECPPGRPFDPPDGLRERGPVSRLAYPDGHVGWLVTGHELAREVLADSRFSVRPDLGHRPVAGMAASDGPAPPGILNALDPPDHTRYRKLLAGRFTVRRMRRLTERIDAVTAERLDAMARTGGPVDLVPALAQPVPAQVICELLGVPYAERAEFQERALELFRLGADPATLASAYAAVHGAIAELVAANRAEPGDDLLSELAGTDLTEEELVNIGFVLLGAGLDTTANMLAHGTYALLTHPGQVEELRADPDRAVEELLRYLSVVPFTLRTALTEVELGGERIAAGETVTVSLSAANRDPARYADPDTLDVARQASGHVTFGHGIHQCLGQQLARVELRVTLPALVARFPTLRLAVPAADVPLRADMIILGVHALPVTWKD
ncbi:MAG TPA: cytochrome P450 [Actinocatenispora sp.]